MPDMSDTFSPIGWRQVQGRDGSPVTGLWVKELLRGVSLGQTFLLSRYDSGATFPMHELARDQQQLVIEGSVDETTLEEDGTTLTRTYHKGAFIDYSAGTQHQSKSTTGCLLLITHQD